MSLVNLSLPGLLTGLLAIAGVLFLLQRLRVRYRERTVITTLFWKQALAEARRRVLVRRFKHPLAYLFVLVICSLLWLGFAQPRSVASTGQSYVILLDASAAMAHGQRFADTVDLALAQASRLPVDRRRVILCGGRPRPLLEPGENLLLVRERLATAGPEACPPSVERTLRALTRELPESQEVTVIVAGDAPISATMADLLPDRVHLTRLAPDGDAAGSDNRAITALGVAPAASGAWEHVDVLCEVTHDGSGEPALAVSLDGKPAALEASHTRSGPRSRIVFADVPAAGQLLEVRLRGADDVSADDHAEIRLPERSRIRVSLDPLLAGTVGPVLAADPAVLVTDDAPTARVAVADTPAGTGVPTLVFVPISAQDDAIVLHEPSERVADISDTFQQLGLDQVDAMDVAQASGRRISIGATTGERRAISVWRPLLGQSFNFVQSRSFPLFVARALRWLAGTETEPFYVAAGEPVAGVLEAQTASNGAVLDPVGADFIPPRAGRYVGHDGHALAAALPGPAPGAALAELEPASLDAVGSGAGDWALWLGLVVLVLLVAEWYVFGTGRMP